MSFREAEYEEDGLWVMYAERKNLLLWEPTHKMLIYAYKNCVP